MAGAHQRRLTQLSFFRQHNTLNTAEMDREQPHDCEWEEIEAAVARICAGKKLKPAYR